MNMEMNEEMFKLTIPQNSIWLTDQFYQSNTISNIGGTLLFHEPVTFDKLEEAINLFIQKNDVMRLSLKIVDGIPYQYIKDYKPVKIKKFSFSSETELKEKEKEFINVDLDIRKSFLYEFRLVEMPNQKGGFNVTLHHLICDAWSMSLLINQIVTLYSKLKNGKIVEKTETSSYVDYIKNEQTYFLSEKFKKDTNYWEKVFKEPSSLISFSTKSSPAINGKASRFIYPLENSADIYDFCQKHNIPILTFFMTIFSLYLYKISNVNDIVLGTPILNRNGIKEKHTVGMFVNTLPMKIHIDADVSFLDLTKQISKEQFALFRHHKYPYSNILKYVREKHNFSNNLYDTIISYQNARDNSKTSDISYSTNWDFCGEISNSLDIHIYDMDDSGTLKLYYDYQLEKFDEVEIKNINHRILYIIKQILKNESISIQQIELLDKEENQILDNFNKNETTYNKEETIISLFEKQVKKTPNNQALQFKDTVLTYAQLYKQVCKFANHLRKKGIHKNTPVVLLINRTLEMVIAMLATLKAGGYYIAIDPYWPADRTNFIIQNSNSNFLITSEKYVANYEDKMNCILVETISKLKDSSVLENETTPEDLAYILYTSGSTGQPKGTLITNKNVVGLLNSTNHIFKQTEQDIWTLFHTYTFDFSTWEIYGSLLYGCKLIVIPKEITTNPKEFFNLVIREKVTILNQTPAYFYKVIEQEKLFSLSPEDVSLRYIILGGEAVQAKPLKYFKNKYPNITIYNGYGPTETTVFAIMGEITKEDIFGDSIYIGKPISNYQIHILDKNLKPLPIGVEGEICISGVGVCNGYFKKPDLTKEKFLHTRKYGLLYKSGDVGYFCPDGRIRYIGRNDNQIKIRGFRIELDEIQKQILNCDHVKKAVVVPVDNNNFTKSLVAFFEADKPDITADVLEEIKKHLTSYMIPKLYQIDEFPINNNGKIDTKLLISTVYENNAHTVVVEPENETEKELLDILKSLTNIQCISTQDDFFEDLGLDSLNVMDFATKLSKYQIEIQDINNYTTIQKLANKIIHNKSEKLYSDKIQNDVTIQDTHFSYNLTNVLLTGFTGFLGSHLFYELLVNPDVQTIYCLIRKKYNVSIQERFDKIISHYFSDCDIQDLIEQKVILLDGNFEENDLGLQLSEYTDIKNIITTVIHSGANVRHYGKYETFYRANVQATKNIIRFCKDANAALAHISTISVGGYCKFKEDKLLTENDINIKQNFRNHVYMVTKYEAECEILKETENNHLQAKIFRLGNIMPRIKDGKFQINMHQNGFLSRLKTLIDIKATTKEINQTVIDVSPVDVCAHFIIKLMQNPSTKTIYHISHSQLLTINDIISGFGLSLKEVNISTCIDLIRDLNQPLNGHLMNDLISSDYKEVPFSSEITNQYLHELGLNWPDIDKSYLCNLYHLILQL